MRACRIRRFFIPLSLITIAEFILLYHQLSIIAFAQGLSRGNFQMGVLTRVSNRTPSERQKISIEIYVFLQFLHLHPNFPSSSGINSAYLLIKDPCTVIIPSTFRTNRNLLCKQNDIAFNHYVTERL